MADAPVESFKAVAFVVRDDAGGWGVVAFVSQCGVHLAVSPNEAALRAEWQATAEHMIDQLGRDVRMVHLTVDAELCVRRVN